MKNLKKIKADNFIEDAIIEDITKKKLKKIITRFPPEPNGYPHIGHIRAIMTDFNCAKKFGGYTNLRMDDTNPEKESMEFVEHIKDDISWLGYKWKNLFYASSYYGKLYKFALRMIKSGKAYVCDLSSEEISQNRGSFTQPGTDSPYRNRTIEENLKLFKEMREGKYPDGSKTLRAKIDMASPNMNMRDPIMYRITRHTHFRTGNKWCIYPIYDFAHPLSDAIEGITHSLCSMEFEDHRPLYDWFLQEAGFTNVNRRPRQIEFSKLQIEGSIIGKRYVKQMIEKGYVDGFDDPRLLTIKAMRRRGYTAAGLNDFVKRTGLAKENTMAEFQYLEHCIREDLNKVATRVMVVLKPLKVIITNYPVGRSELIEVDNNPNNKAEGSHTIKFEREIYIEQDDFSENPPPKYFRLVPEGIVRLKGAYIIRCDRVVRDNKGEIEHLECSYIAESKSGNDISGLKAKGTIHWVNAQDCIDLTVRNFKPIMKDGVEFKGDIEEVFNRDSSSVIEGVKGEMYLTQIAIGKQMQFMRNGYYVQDINFPDKNIYLNTADLKDSYKPKA